MRFLKGDWNSQDITKTSAYYISIRIITICKVVWDYWHWRNTPKLKVSFLLFQWKSKNGGNHILTLFRFFQSIKENAFEPCKWKIFYSIFFFVFFVLLYFINIQRILHNCGAILYFQNEKEHKDFLILNPEWIASIVDKFFQYKVYFHLWRFKSASEFNPVAWTRVNNAEGTSW